MALELLRRRRARVSAVEYARYIEVPGAPVTEEEDEEHFKPVETVLARHHEIILQATQRCIKRHSGRSMLFLPPGSAKSTYGTVVAPTWAMGEQPGFKVIGVSYGSDLARKFGRRMRSIVRQAKYRALFSTSLSTESSAADEWALDNGSEYMGGGILSGITGNRADFIPVDDPIKGRQEADSEVTRKRTIEAYQDDVLTRLKPGGSVMLTQTRWHEADLAGAILPEKYNGESGMIECRDGNVWEVICIPAKAEHPDDFLGRQIGEYIWPEWFPRDHWAQFERVPRTWSALYQQRPSPETGSYWKAEWLRYYEQPPAFDTLNIYGASDFAVSEGRGDYTVHLIVGMDSAGNLWLLDFWREQASADRWVTVFCDLVKKWQPIGWAFEKGQIDSSVGPFLVREMQDRQAYVPLSKFPTNKGGKPARARSMQGRVAIHGLNIPRAASWLEAFLSEWLTFPNGANDDIGDTLGLLGQLLDEMVEGSEPETAKPDLHPIEQRKAASPRLSKPARKPWMEDEDDDEG